MKHFFLTIAFLVAVAMAGFSQKSGFDINKLRIGGSFGLAINNDYTTINVSPQVGYAFNNLFTAGVGVSYNYYKYSDIDVSQSYFGGNVYGRFTPIRYIAFQVQPEGYYMNQKAYGEKKNMFIPSVLVGAGVVLPAGGRGGISAMIYYDIVQYKKDGINYSPYGDKIVYSIGYVFSF